MFEIRDQVIPGSHRILDVYLNGLFVAQATKNQVSNRTFWYPIANTLAEVPPRISWDSKNIEIRKGLTHEFLNQPILDLGTMTTAEASAVVMQFIHAIEQMPTTLT